MRVGHNKLWDWFSCSRASFLVIPRSFMHEMPDEWQGKMAELLDEYDRTFDTVDEVDSVYVSAKKGNRFIKIPEWITNYRHPNRNIIKNHMK